MFTGGEVFPMQYNCNMFAMDLQYVRASVLI